MYSVHVTDLHSIKILQSSDSIDRSLEGSDVPQLQRVVTFTTLIVNVKTIDNSDVATVVFYSLRE